MTTINPAASIGGTTALSTVAAAPLPATFEVSDAAQQLSRLVAGKQAGKFDFATLTPQAVGQMGTANQIRVAVQYLDEMDGFLRRTLKAARRLDPQDWEGLSRIHKTFVEEKMRLDRLQSQIPEGAGNRQWISALFSSGDQVTIGPLEQASPFYSAPGDRDDWDQMMRQIRKIFPNVERKILGQNGYKISHAKKELGETVINWLFQNFPRRNWVAGKLELRNTSGVLWRGNPRDPFRPAWPPRAKDPHIEKYLQILGWKIETRTETNSSGKRETIVTLDFGRVSISSSDPQAVLRRADGKFELAAMTPADVATLPDAEKLELCKQLVEAIYLHCELVYFHANDLMKPGKKKSGSMQRFLEEEYHRLLELFPKFGEARPAEFVRRIQLSVSRAAEGMIASFRLKEEELFDPARQIPHYLRNGGEGFTMDRARLYLAVELAFWLRHHSSREDFLAGGWFLECPQQADPNNTGFPVLWPADPDHDEVLKMWLGILGWKMGVEKRKAQFWITVNFGDAALHEGRITVG